MMRPHETIPSETATTSRRRFVRLAGAGLAAALGGSLCRGAEEKKKEPKKQNKPPKGLRRGDKVDIGGKGEEIIQKAYELGHKYEKQHGGCARCTVAALQAAVPFVEVNEDVLRTASCLDGGATPVAVQNCGGFTGCGIVIGHLCGGISMEGGKLRGDTKLAHELLHKVYAHFKEAYGTVLCRDVRKGAKGDCPEVVGRAAKWAAEVILREFTDYRPKEDKRPEKKEAKKPETKPSNKPEK